MCFFPTFLTRGTRCQNIGNGVDDIRLMRRWCTAILWSAALSAVMNVSSLLPASRLVTLSLSLSSQCLNLKWAEVSRERTGPLQSGSAEGWIMFSTIRHRRSHQHCCSYVKRKHKNTAQRTHRFLFKLDKIHGSKSPWEEDKQNALWRG